MKTHWNSRIIKFYTENYSYYAIHEVYYNDDSPVSFTENAIKIIADDIDELERYYKLMGKAFEKSVLDSKIFE